MKIIHFESDKYVTILRAENICRKMTMFFDVSNIIYYFKRFTNILSRYIKGTLANFQLFWHGALSDKVVFKMLDSKRTMV